MRSTMQDHPLLVSDILVHGQAVHGRSEVVTFDGDGYRSASFRTVGERAEQLASALERLGVGLGDRVATFCMNHQEHVEAYMAVPSMGAVLHTLNVRLFPEQLKHVVNDASDKVVILDAVLAPALARVLADCPSVEHLVVVGEGDVSCLGRETIGYEELIAGETPGREWPVLDERDAAAMCYTSGTTGNPKGVVYSHRSMWLHSLAATSSSTLGLSGGDRILVVVPQFHANAWGAPYAGWFAGADLIMPRQFLQAAPLARILADQRPTVAMGVPTIWNDLLRYAEVEPVDGSSLRVVVCGGSAVPRSLMEGFEKRFGAPILQAWGMTETSPLGAVAHPPRGMTGEEAMAYRMRTGRVAPGVRLRVVTPDGEVATQDGVTVGEFEIRGPWVTASYHGDPSPEKFHDGWLRTGDVGTLDADGYMQISDRTKDVVKTGGEWISSVELENAIMAHEAIFEAAVVGVPDEKWGERPLACVVVVPDRAAPGAQELAAFLEGRVARWWVPERWSFVDEIPKTSVGKFDKKVLRARFGADELDVVDIDRPPAPAAAATGAPADGPAVPACAGPLRAIRRTGLRPPTATSSTSCAKRSAASPSSSPTSHSLRCTKRWKPAPPPDHRSSASSPGRATPSNAPRRSSPAPTRSDGGGAASAGDVR
jgi:fatty-acyl-CoA synthase